MERKTKVLGFAAVVITAAMVMIEAQGTSGKEDTKPNKPAAAHEKTYQVGSVSFTMKKIAAVTNGSVGHKDESDNKPHMVSLSAYLIGETEVTQELWQAVMGNNPSGFNGNSGQEAAEGEEQKKRPVENITWYECIAFCNELTKSVSELGAEACVYYSDAGKTKAYTKGDAENRTTPVKDMSKKGFRLPTEAEWEWAAKGGKDYKWAGTDKEAELENYAWYRKNSGDKTHEVKKKEANGYGLYDMSGNVWEWCWDWYEGSTPAAGQTDPTGAVCGSSRVVRGGSWYSSADYGVRAYRCVSDPDSRNDFLGVRVVLRP